MMYNTQAIGQLANAIGQQGQAGPGGSERDSGFKTLKPKKDITIITCGSAKLLMQELLQFEIDLGELGVGLSSEAAYRQLKGAATDRARDVIDYEIVQGRGRELKEQLENLVVNGTRPQRDWMGGELYRYCVSKLEQSVRLTPERRLQIAEELYGECRMTEDTYAEVENFLSRWRRARMLLHKERLVNPSSSETLNSLAHESCPPYLLAQIQHQLENSERREMQDFLDKRISATINAWIKGQPLDRQPTNIEECIRCLERYLDVFQRVADQVGPGKKIHGMYEPQAVCDQSETASVPTPAEDPGQVSAISQRANAEYLATRGKVKSPGVRSRLF